MAKVCYRKKRGDGICKFCNEPVSARCRGQNRRCDRHYRILKMVKGSIRRGLFTPDESVLDSMIDETGENLSCPSCGKSMTFHSSANGMADVLSIQHNSDGTVSLLCLSCNSRHGNMHNRDSRFPQCGADKKSCGVCKEILPLDEFYAGNCYRGRQGSCKKCSLKLSKQYIEKNADKMRAWRKKYHLSNKDRLNERSRIYHEQNKDEINARHKRNKLKKLAEST